MTAHHTLPFATLVLTCAFAARADYTLTVATADASKGSVTAAGGTYPEGTAVTITATPESGYTFTRWDGVHPSLRLDNPLVLPVTNDTTATAVFGKTYYVATDGSDSTTDGTNPATPYKTIEKAATAAANGDTISVGAGTFAGSADLSITAAVVLRGQGMAATIRSGKKTTLNNDNAIAADMRFYGYNGAGAVTITKGNLLRCDISGNNSTVANGIGIRASAGSIVGSVITNNWNGSGGGSGIGILVQGGPFLLEDCLIADNSTGYAGVSGGVTVNFSDTTHKKPAILRHCTIVRNSGGEGASTCGGLYIGNSDFKLVVEGCLIGGNAKFTDETPTGTDDAFLQLSVNTQGLRVFRDTVISHMATPNRPAYFTFENCVTNVAPGYADLLARDFTITRRSPAWGLCADGSDAGCFQSPRDGSFDVGCYPLTNSVCGRLETPLVAKAENAPDATVAFEWDLDGDGVFEATGPVANGVWTTPGRHAVTVRATSGGQTVTRTVPDLVYVAPREIFAWPSSPSPAFPYATWDTAAHTVNEAVDAAVDGCKVQLTNAYYQVSASVRVCHDVEIGGTGTENNSVRYQAGSITGNNRIDANATGTCVQYNGGSVAPFRLYRSGILLHDMVVGPGSPTVVGLYENAIVSNCVIRSGQYTAGSGVGVYARAGLVTHCVISNNYTTGKGDGGSVSLLLGGATLRNCLVCDANHKSTSTSTPAKGTIYAADGCTVESCTIVNNKATIGGGIYMTGAAIVRNNIIRDNTAPADTTGHPDWYDADGNALFSNNCTSTSHHEGDATVTEAPEFITVNGRNTFTFASGSPCVDKGVVQPWMANATDLFGNARLQGAAPDIGCFEADMTQLTCDISATPASALGATNVVLTAVFSGGTPPAGAQYLWDLDGDGETDATGPSVTETFPEGRYTIGLKVKDGDDVLFDITKENAVTIYPHTIYLVTSNPDCAFPYNTLQTAATNVNEAVDAALDGAEIVVFGGNHRAYRKILIDKAVTIHAAPGLAERPQIKRYEEALDIFFTVGHAGALVEGLVLDNRQKATHALNITVAGGTVRDCVVSNAYYSVGSGIGLTIANGLFDRGVIVGTSAAQDGAGLAVHMSGNARVSNSLIHRNTVRNSSKNGVVYVTGNARLENCTVVSNTCGATPAVYCSGTTAGGTAAVVNCIIRDNYFKSTPAADYLGGADWFVSTTAESIAWSNNCTAVAYQAGDRTVTEDPRFRDPAKSDYTLGKGTPCRNKGVRRDWMDDALDLNGNPRIFGSRPDIGCYEYTGRDAFILFMQ